MSDWQHTNFLAFGGRHKKLTSDTRLFDKQVGPAWCERSVNTQIPGLMEQSTGYLVPHVSMVWAFQDFYMLMGQFMR
jgi:hypothetical protein